MSRSKRPYFGQHAGYGCLLCFVIINAATGRIIAQLASRPSAPRPQACHLHGRMRSLPMVITTSRPQTDIITVAKRGKLRLLVLIMFNSRQQTPHPPLGMNGPDSSWYGSNALALW